MWNLSKAALVGGIILAASLAAASEPVAAADGLAGRWNGTGTVVLPSGAAERARCRATFKKAGGRGFDMDAVCATSSLRVAQTATLQQSGPNRFSGEFLNTEYNVQGTINLTLQGDKLTAALRGGGGTAYFSLTR
jgi:hypothetical protein